VLLIDKDLKRSSNDIPWQWCYEVLKTKTKSRTRSWPRPIKDRVTTPRPQQGFRTTAVRTIRTAHHQNSFLSVYLKDCLYFTYSNYDITVLTISTTETACMFTDNKHTTHFASFICAAHAQSVVKSAAASLPSCLQLWCCRTSTTATVLAGLPATTGQRDWMQSIMQPPTGAATWRIVLFNN